MIPDWTSHGLISRLLRAGLGLAACMAVAILPACSTPPRLDAPPPAVADKIHVLGIPNARFWIDREASALVQEAVLAAEREARAVGRGPRGALPPAYFLALSGGADDGAFGAGLLVGWTATGQRPEFKLVTGISTGALIAPFAFLGPRYDVQLRQVFTDVTQENIFTSRGITAALFNDALRDTAPLFALISSFLNETLLADIAREYAKGRLLLIGTTNIDLQRPVIWNIGAIAASGKPGALELVRKILLASAAVPGAFPPVLIDVEVNGQRYQEMHVDGGAVAQTFLYPSNVRLYEKAQALGIERDRVAYVIRNGRLDPEWTNTTRSFVSIAGRAISTLIYYSGVNDVYRIYNTTQRDHVQYYLAYIGADFDAERTEDFDHAYMNALFDYAYAKASHGYPWATAPPTLQGHNENR